MNTYSRWFRVLATIAGGWVMAGGASAQSLEWRLEQIYSNADGSIQFAVMYDQSGNTNNMQAIAGVKMSSVHDSLEHAHDPGVADDYFFPNNLPSAQTAGHRFLIATEAFAALNLIKPDYVVAAYYFPQSSGTITIYQGPNLVDVVSWTAKNPLPSDGVNARFRDNGRIGPNIATNFAGQSASVPNGATPPPPVTATAIEYKHAVWNHYFVTKNADEITKLDNGTFVGWARTGLSFKVYPTVATGSSAVCRFFSTAFNPKSSHFYTPFASECASVKNLGTWQYEGTGDEVFWIAVAAADGTCPAGTLPVYRLYNNGEAGAPNHRFTTDVATRDQQKAAGWVIEGNGPGLASMCAPT